VEEAAAAAKSMEDQTSAMADMVGQFVLSAEFERGQAAPVRGPAKLTGNPVVDRSLRSGKEPVANVRASRPASGAAEAARRPRADDEAAAPRRAVGADWKEF